MDFSFKTWINEVNAGFAREFKKRHPHLNDYIVKQILSNGLGATWRNSGLSGGRPGGDSPTVAWKPGNPTYNSVGDMFNDPRIAFKTQADYGSKPIKVSISPADLDPEDLFKMQLSDFGNSALSGVRDDAARHTRQRELAAERGEDNEPVILQRKGQGRYKVVEGFHRLMAYFYQSCPEQIRYQIDSPKKTDWNVIDLSQWPRVTVNAYVGKPFSNNN